MNIIYNFFPHQLVDAVGWTIIHSFWQGIVIAVLLGVVLLISGKKSAKLRYNFSLASLIAMFILSAATFVQVYDSAEVKNAQVYQPAAGFIFTDPLVQTYNAQVKTNPDKDITEALENFFAGHLNLIVTIWLAGFIIFSVRFAGGLLYVQRLRTSGINPVDDEFWFFRLRDLSKTLELKQVIKIYESVKVKAPITIGYIKPVILLPLGMLSGLPQDQVEAIILHELAHIKRYDFLLNLLQTVIETIFFYHPAVWWISTVIKNERENCCDDLTLKLCSGSLVYFKALYNLQQICSEEKDIVLAAIGKKNQLFRRINRMNSNNTNVRYGVKFMAFAVTLVLFAAASMYSTSFENDRSSNIVTASFINPFNLNVDPVPDAPPIPDTSSLKKGRKTLKFDDGDTRYKAKLNNGKLEELFINGDKVDKNDLSKYEGKVTERVDEYDSTMSEFHDNMKQFNEKMRSLGEKMKKFKSNHYYGSGYLPYSYGQHQFMPFNDSSGWQEMAKNIQHNIQESFANHSFRVPPVPPINIPPIHIPPINIPKIDWESTDDCGSFDCEEYKDAMKEWSKNFKKEMENFKWDSQEFKDQMIRLKEELKESGVCSESFKEQMETLRKELKEKEFNNGSFKKNMEELKKNMGKLKEELKPLKEFTHDLRHGLVEDKIITDSDDLDDLSISQKEMVVNGKIVPEDLHQKYLELYKKHFGKELKEGKEFRINY